jgi:hypothetical protein
VRLCRALERARAARAPLSAGTAAFVLLVALGNAAAAQETSPLPAAEGTALIEAVLASPLTLVGIVRDRRALDAQAWRAELEVESAVVGDAASRRVAFAWEELSASRPPRFATGDRVLLALAPLPPASLWQERFPDVRERLSMRVVAQDGAAFLRDPSPGSVLTLRHYAALPAAARSGPDAARHLLALVAEAEPALAFSAATTLQGARLESPPPAGVADLALDALARADADAELQEPLLGWLRATQPALGPPLDAAIARASAPRAFWFRARAALAGGLAPARATALLASPSASHRIAGIESAGKGEAQELARLAKNDAAPEVRSAAVVRVAEVQGMEGLDAVLAVFSDRELEVRGAAARAAAGLGAPAVPRLREVALRWPEPAPVSAVMALRFVRGPEARAALAEIAETHPEEGVRFLANAALGKPVGHRH